LALWIVLRATRGRSPFAPKWSVVHVFASGQLGLAVLVPLAFLVGIAWGMSGSPDDLKVLADPRLVLVLFALQNAIFVLVPVVFFSAYRVRVRDLGLSRRQITRGLLLGMAWFIPVFLITGALEAGSAWMSKHVLPHHLVKVLERVQELGAADPFLKNLTVSGWVLIFVAFAILTPIGEEMFFRGFLYNSLRMRWGVRWGIAISGVVFALSHLQLLMIVPYLFLSMMLPLCYARTRTLVAPMTIHFLNNGMLVLLVGLGVLKP
jgi:membrane protease YdiL (CAAX protease family)